MKIEGIGVYLDVADSIYYFTTPEGMERLDRFPRGRPVFGPESDQLITNVLSGKKGDLYSLTLKNGNSISLGKDSHVFTVNGWKSIQDITSEDYIFQASTKPRYFNNAGKVVPYKNNTGKRALPIFIPDKLTQDFCRWIGMFMGSGYIHETAKTISFTTDNEQLAQLYIKLTKKIFTITPEIVVENRESNRKPIYIFRSQNVISFIKTFFGKGVFQKIPAFLLESSLEEQIEFLKGLQYQAFFNKEEELVFIKTTSKLVSTFVSNIFQNCGYVSFVTEEKKKSFSTEYEEGKTFIQYQVRVLGVGSANYPIELEDSKMNQYLNSYANCLVLWEDFLNHKPKSFHKNFWAWDNLKTKKEKLLKLNIVKELYPEYNFEGYFVRVKSIKNLENRNLINLKLLSPKGFYINSFLITGI